MTYGINSSYYVEDESYIRLQATMTYEEVIERLAEFYRAKYPIFDEREERIRAIGFTKIVIDITSPSITFIVRNPGRIIGVRGRDIEQLQTYFTIPLRIEESQEQLIEDDIILAVDRQEHYTEIWSDWMDDYEPLTNIVIEEQPLDAQWNDEQAYQNHIALEGPDLHPDGCFYCGGSHFSTNCRQEELNESSPL